VPALRAVQSIDHRPRLSLHVGACGAFGAAGRYVRMVWLSRRVLGHPAKRAVRRAWNGSGGAARQPKPGNVSKGGECNNVQHQTCVNPRFLVIDMILRKCRFPSFLRGNCADLGRCHANSIVLYESVALPTELNWLNALTSMACSGGFRLLQFHA
jgi:hypothetical protein